MISKFLSGRRLFPTLSFTFWWRPRYTEVRRKVSFAWQPSLYAGDVCLLCCCCWPLLLSSCQLRTGGLSRNLLDLHHHIGTAIPSSFMVQAMTGLSTFPLCRALPRPMGCKSFSWSTHYNIHQFCSFCSYIELSIIQMALHWSILVFSK